MRQCAGHRRGADSDGQVIGAKGLAIKEGAAVQPKAGVELVVFAPEAERFDIDAQLADESGRDRTVWARAVDLERAAVEELQTLAHVKFIALGVAAEVIMIVQHQNARIGAVPGPKEMRGRQSADTTADDDEIVGLPGVAAGPRIPSIPQRVCGFE